MKREFYALGRIFADASGIRELQVEEENDDVPLMIECGIHKQWARSAVVCCHLVGDTGGEIRGFVEKSDDPDDSQAWCGRCEDLFVEEDDMTERFRAFNDMRLVCEFCYADIKRRHTGPDAGEAEGA